MPTAYKARRAPGGVCDASPTTTAGPETPLPAFGQLRLPFTPSSSPLAPRKRFPNRQGGTRASRRVGGGPRGGRRTGRGRRTCVRGSRTCVRGRQRLADGGAAAGDGLDGDVLLNHPHLDGRPEGRVCREDAGYRGPRTASGSGDGAVKPHLAPTPPCAVGRGEPCGFGTLSLVAFLFFGGWGEGNCQKGCWKLRFTPNCRNVLMKPEFHGLFLHSRTVPGRLSWEDISVRAETQYK